MCPWPTKPGNAITTQRDCNLDSVSDFIKSHQQRTKELFKKKATALDKIIPVSEATLGISTAAVILTICVPYTW